MKSIAEAVGSKQSSSRNLKLLVLVLNALKFMYTAQIVALAMVVAYVLTCVILNDIVRLFCGSMATAVLIYSIRLTRELIVQWKQVTNK